PQPSTPDPRPPTLDPRPSAPDPRPSAPDPRHSTLDPRHSTLKTPDFLMNRAVFRDRDGTIVEEKSFLHRPAEAGVHPGPGLDLAQSFMIGDKLTDLECGWNAGVKKCILVRTGYGKDWEKASPEKLKLALIVEHLAAAANWILDQGLGPD